MNYSVLKVSLLLTILISSTYAIADTKNKGVELGQFSVEEKPALIITAVKKDAVVAAGSNNDSPEIKPEASQMPMNYKILASDKLLSINLIRWCKQTSTQCTLVRYDAVDDIRVEANADFGGDFRTAINSLFDSINNHTKDSRFKYRLTKNGVLLITSENN